MFLTKDYIYQKEFTTKRGVSINNLSNLFKAHPEAYDNLDIVRLGINLFFRKTSRMLGPVYGTLARSEKYTDFSNKLVCSYLKHEYQCSIPFLESQKYGKTIDICGTKVFEFNEEFVKKYDKTWYSMCRRDLRELLLEMPDLDYFQVDKNQFIVSY